ncbi:lysozyme-like isoform X2 [Cylas formicarius]|uniref:lysozyme-like isoform X2 n=1 Tax=Cylas formicarius TaxID=197179 RepID=UPI0029587BE5|nr:lysozyme-like isoform X2 [Cylas formicarius]
MSKVWFFVGFVFVSVYVPEFESKVFTKCGLTKELLQNKFDRTLVGNWVCLIESESAKNTSKVIVKANGSKSLGLFQINSKDWCKFGSKGGKCNIKCEDLIDDDICLDSLCAKQIYKEMGFRFWEGWVRNCYGRNIPFPNCPNL